MKKILVILKRKWADYLLEILVIIIGILLAFMMEKWNQERKLKSDELMALKELREDLLLNVNDLEENISTFKRCIKSIEVIQNSSRHHLPYNDSIDNHFAFLYPYVVFNMNQTTFENLKTSGLTLISNDSLRRSISFLLGTNYRNYQKLEEAFLVDNHNRNILPMWLSKFSTFERNYPKGSASFHVKPSDYEELLANTEFMQILSYSADMYTTFARMQGFLIDDTKVLIIKVESEIWNLEN